MKKKIKISLILSLAIIFGCFSNVFAATNQNNKADKISQVKKNTRFLQSLSTDDGVVGTSNLNGTANNSAKVGDSLTSPEIGWKRYGAYNKNIKFTGSWYFYGIKESGVYYNDITLGTANTAINSHQECPSGSTLEFNFTGKKIRLLFWFSGGSDNNSTDVEIKINNSETVHINTRQGNSKHCVIAYENTNLQDENNIKITNLTSYQFCIDGIDIDQAGEIKAPTTIPTTGNRATLTINMVNGSSKQYDLSEDELNSFLSWYNGMTNPLSAQCYTFNNPITGPYLNNKDYIPFNKIDDFKVQEYTK